MNKKSEEDETMFIGLLERFLKKTAVLAVGVSILLTMGLVNVQAAPKPFTCSISPADGTVTAGVPIMFTGNTQGGKGRISYSWDFSDGPGDPVASTERTVDVVYADAGVYTVSLDATDKKGTVNCSTTVTVKGGGGGDNQPPTLNPIGSVAVTVAGDLIFTVTASDDGQPNGTLTISASNLPAGASFTDNGDGTGDFEWLNA
ncbi:MAG: PKD domain-containing protein, partial [Gammaproteobacteria bacterium]|nr:PKD domain-containing protein [Gammaproteobacteria bacterium]